jgi:hypothetical protein
VRLDVLLDTIQPFPTFSEIYLNALKAPTCRSPSLSNVRKPLDSAYACVYVAVLATSATSAVALNGASVAPTGARLGVGEGHARHGLVVGLTRLAQDVGGLDASLVLADVRQRPDPGDVADRPQALAGAQLIVDPDAARLGLNADGLQPDAVDARAPAGGDEQAVAAQLAAVVELQHVVPARAARGAHVDAEDELDPVASAGSPRRAHSTATKPWPR